MLPQIVRVQIDCTVFRLFTMLNIALDFIQFGLRRILWYELILKIGAPLYFLKNLIMQI